MFERKLPWAMQARGLDVDAFESLLRDELYLSNNKLSAISKFIIDHSIPIILTKNVGKLTIQCKRSSEEISYIVKTKNPCTLVVNFREHHIHVEYTDVTLLINKDLSDYYGEHTKLNDARQYFLNEILIRYFSQVLYAIYRELRWFA